MDAGDERKHCYVHTRGAGLRHRTQPALSGPRPSAFGLGIVTVYVCVSFFVQNLHVEHPRPGEGWPGPNVTQEKKNQKYSDSSTGFSEERRGKKSHLCVSFISVALGEENTASLPASCSSMGRTNSKTPIFSTLNPPKLQEFSFSPSFFFFLFKLIGFSLSCFFLFFFVLSPAWVGVFVGFFCFSLGCAEAAGRAGFRIAPCRFSLYSSFSSSSSGSETRF